MKKFEGILICTDLDGTLLGSNRKISRENLEAIEYFKSEGGIFTFITGRMPFFVSDIYNAVHPNAPFGCINGGGIYDHRTQKYVWTRETPREVLELVKYVEDNLGGVGIQVNTFDKIYFCRENPVMETFRQITKVPNIVKDIDEIDEPVAKILFGEIEEENMQKLIRLLASHPKADKFDFIRSEDTLYEILPKGSSKGSVLPRLAEHLGIDMERTVAVGDYNNDIAMLKTAKLGIAVANACPEAKAVADHITVSNDDHAIAKIISDIGNGILKI